MNARQVKGTTVAIEKPLPMQIGNKYYFTLTSYDPVSITVNVPMVIEEDIDLSLEEVASSLKTTVAELDDAKVAESFGGNIKSVAELRDSLRSELTGLNAHYAEESKKHLCVEALAKRLGQQIPPRMIAEHAHIMTLQFEAELEREGGSLEAFLQETGMPREVFERRFNEDALRVAEQISALDAYVDEKKLTVADEEVPALLNMPKDEAEDLVRDAREHGAFEELRSAAKRNKAVDVLVASCSCTYHHETPDEAKARLEHYRQMLEAQRELEALRAQSEESEPEKDSGFKLV